jgi:hypothetical protein
MGQGDPLRQYQAGIEHVSEHISKKPAPRLIRGGSRVSEKIMLNKKLDFDPIHSNRIKT